MAFGTLRADTIQSDGGTAKTVNDLLVSGGDLGAATATTPATGDDDTSVATTAFVKAQNYLTSGANIGAATATTPSAGDNDTSVATTAYVQAEGFTKAATSNEWTAGQRGEVTNLDSSSGVLAIDFDASNNFHITTTENIADIDYTDLNQNMVGQSGSIFFTYGGNHTIGGWDAETRWSGGDGSGGGAPTFTATNGKVDRVDYLIVTDRDTPTQRSHVRVHMVATLNMTN